MKSRLIKAQNQRVERISPSTLVVGIDIAKENHAAQAINFRGVVLTSRAIMIFNTLVDFNTWSTVSASCSKLMAWTTSSWEWKVRKLHVHIKGL